jgi:hypothetical protein
LLYIIAFVIFIELFFPKTSVLFDFLYGSRSSILTGPLGTSYFMGYIAFFLSLHFLFLFKYLKTIILFINFILPFLFFPKRFFFITLVIYITFLFLFFNFYSFEILSEYLISLNINSYNISSMIRLLNNAEGAGTFSVRREQIDFVLENSTQRYGFGIGLGRGILLESWISYLGHRYGTIGLVFYVLMWSYLFLKLFFSSKNKYSFANFNFVSLGFWFAFQPILLFSGGMNESGFTGLFSSIVLGYAITLIKRKDCLFFS